MTENLWTYEARKIHLGAMHSLRAESFIRPHPNPQGLWMVNRLVMCNLLHGSTENTEVYVLLLFIYLSLIMKLEPRSRNWFSYKPAKGDPSISVLAAKVMANELVRDERRNYNHNRRMQEAKANGATWKEARA